MERRVLAMAASSIGDDIEHYGLTATEINAYHRAMKKLWGKT